MVLGRLDYNQLFGSLNDPRNLKQLSALSNLNCLFYGFSFKDPNVDRLLEVAAQVDRSNSALPPEEFLETSDQVVRHVALRRADSGQPGNPRWKNWTVGDELDFSEEQRIAQRFVYRVGRDDFEQHRRFVIELVRRLAIELDFEWPGRWKPKHQRLDEERPLDESDL